MFATVALLGMLAIYFVPNKKIVSSSALMTTSQPVAASLPSTATTTSTTTQPAASSTSTTPATSNTSTYKDGTFTGSSVSTRYGTVKIAITVSSGKISSVNFISLPDNDMRSSMISSQASPILQSQTLAAQSASIDGVSGATYTSEGYMQSLQAAIDAAHA